MGTPVEFVFTSVLLREGHGVSALCLDLDVASQGRTPAQAKKNLLEAVTLYLESAIEHNLPFVRPVPSEEDPRAASPESLIEVFDLKLK